MMKIYILVILLILGVSGCAKPIQVMPPLPKMCGNHNIVYGTVDKDGVFRDTKGQKIGRGLHPKLTGKTVLFAVHYWTQTIGGLISDDGKDYGIHRIENVSKRLIQVVKDGKIDMDNLKKICNELKKKR